MIDAVIDSHELERGTLSHDAWSERVKAGPAESGLGGTGAKSDGADRSNRRGRSRKTRRSSASVRRSPARSNPVKPGRANERAEETGRQDAGGPSPVAPDEASGLEGQLGQS